MEGWAKRPRDHESGGRWIACSVSMDSLLVMDRKRLMKHLETMSCLEKAVPMKELLLAMEEAGEAQSFLVSNGLFLVGSGGILEP